MLWVGLSTLLVWVLANLPLVYLLYYVHGPSGVGRLWGYAPNQFLFPLVIFPFAALATFIALNQVLRLLPDLPKEYSGRPFLEHWPIVILAGVILVSVVTMADYFTNAKSLDKLKPAYATKAVENLRYLHDELELQKKADRDDYLDRMVVIAKRQLGDLALPDGDDSEAVSNMLRGVSRPVFLRIAQDAGLQRRLHLLDPTVHALNVLQLFVSLMVAFCALFAGTMCILAVKDLPSVIQASLPSLGAAAHASLYSVLFFGLYTICYAQQRAEIQPFVGGGLTIMPHVLSGVLVLAMLLGLLSLPHNKTEIGFSESLFRYAPIVVFGSLVGIEVLASQTLRQMIGAESNSGAQIVAALVFGLLSAFPVFRMWLR